MHGALFMPGDVMLDGRALQVLVNRIDGRPRNPECGCNAFVLEDPNYDFRCLHGLLSIRRRAGWLLRS